MFESSFRQNPFAYLRDQFQSLVFGFEFDADQQYLAEVERSNDFRQRDELPSDVSSVLFDLAQQKLRDKIAGLNALDAKRDSLMKFAAGMIVFLAAASKAFAFSVVPFQGALVCFLLAAIVMVMSRRVMDVPAIASIQDIRDGIGKARNSRDWLAASLHKSCEGFAAIERVIACQINFGLFWIVLGLILLVAVTLGLELPAVTDS